jgi:gliding motility-associated lipoprotein GldD
MSKTTAILQLLTSVKCRRNTISQPAQSPEPKRMLQLHKRLLVIGIVLVCFVACNSPYTSKKPGYFKIELPKKEYVTFNEPGFPYSFEYPSYAKIIRDSTYFEENPEDKYWRNIDFGQFNAKIFISYKRVGGKALYKIKQANGQYKDSLGTNIYDNMIVDAFKLTNKNDDIATSKKDSLFRNKNDVTGLLFKLGGNAATQRQFFMTDTTTHFLRAALYFYATPNADSVKPIVDFLQKDIDHMISTFVWRD